MKSKRISSLIFAGIAYLIGQFLLAVTEIFNEAVPYFKWGIFRHLHHDLDAFRKKASERLALVENDSDQSKFHTALSYLRLKNQAASGEVDHHMADYKLLRNLVVVLAIDSAMRAFTKPHQYRVVGIELVLVVICIVAFVRMYNWAQLLAFQYVCLCLPTLRRQTTEHRVPGVTMLEDPTSGGSRHPSCGLCPDRRPCGSVPRTRLVAGMQIALIRLI